MKLPIYMDHHATTPVDARVLARMLPYFAEKFGNAASRSHSFGWQAEEGVEVARKELAELIGAEAQEIVWTSGATESNNLALFGVVEAYAKRGRHIVTQATEHKAVLDPLAVLARRGCEVTVLPVDSFGQVDPDALGAALRHDTVLVSIMAANNEIGTLQRLAEIGARCRKSGVLLHTDAAQAIGKVPFDVDALSVDLASISAHKLYGPKGVGALYVRRKGPRVTLAPQLFGGGHERGRRSGTLNVPGAVGLGAAAAVARRELEGEARRMSALRERLRERLVAALPEVVVNGHPSERLPGNLNICIPGVEAEALLMSLRDVALSSGAACSSVTLEPSHVLGAIGLAPALVEGALRFGLGRGNTDEEVDFVAERVVESVLKLRRLSQRPRFASAPKEGGTQC